MKVCFSCHDLVEEIAYVDPIDRGYCLPCAIQLPIGSVARAMQFLSLTIPFKVGDVVEARTAGEIYDGIGTVTAVHFDLEHGGTPIRPSFEVRIDKKAYPDCPDHICYMESQICLAGEVLDFVSPV